MVLPPGVSPGGTPFVRDFTPEGDSKPRRMAGPHGRFRDENHESAQSAEKSRAEGCGCRAVKISACGDKVELL